MRNTIKDFFQKGNVRDVITMWALKKIQMVGKSSAT